MLRAGTLRDRIHIQRKTGEKDTWNTPLPGAWQNITESRIAANVKHQSGIAAIRADADVSVVLAHPAVRERVKQGLHAMHAQCQASSTHADRAFRARRIVEVYGERDQAPEARIREKDKRRAAWHRFYTDEKWGNVKNYQICLDSGILGIDRCAELLRMLY